MNPANYKDFTTARGLNYHYYFSAAKDAKPTLILMHGFPSTSYDWHNQATYLQEHGYGLIVPDMLGYGGTAKPIDPLQYKFSLITKDLIDILDAEKIEHCIAIGHDWGSIIAARLANYYPDRFEGFAFLDVGYFPPDTERTFDQIVALSRQIFGRDHVGYQAFFAEPGAHVLCEKNFDSFYSLVHCNNAETLWLDFISPLGETKKWVEQNKQAELSPRIPAEDHAYRKQILQKGGLEGPFCWYKVSVNMINREDDKLIPLPAYMVEKPVFLALAEKDTVAVPFMSKTSTEKCCKNLTTKSFSGGHWLLWDNKDEINAELAAWLEIFKFA
ncbi:alpha/beta-hydrolase [Macrolepiota fuliginosa MF-IS2]|uniref:Alpha/beta-hydrolase n=1 Tax=Macrolepiota fuliginosa MF-IS2 TaxID=1400762 RepID=A0A9P5XP00_9AGAR|nr:alpha/beta-hydrolase [Macrolepiota fuliginosa MF-IS2]